MSKGKRYNDEHKLNYSKVIAVIIAIIVIIMFIVIIKNLFAKAKETSTTVETDYYALYANDKWGIVDSTGNTVIEPMYQEMLIVLNNNKDVFLCTYDVNEENGDYKTKVINKKNEEIFTEYDKVEALDNYDSSGNAWYEKDVLKVQKDGKYGLINIDGKQILGIEYDDIRTLKGLENTIIVQKDNLYGLVNKSGVILVKPEYTKVKKIDENSNHGFITVNQENKYGLVSSSGTQILENKYEKIEQIYGENYFVVQENGKRQLIDKNGEVVLQKGFEQITQINNDGIVYTNAGKYGFMNYEGEVLIEPEYVELKEINTGILKAKKGEVYGLIDLEKNKKLSFKYTDINYEDEIGIYIAEDTNYNSSIIDTNFEVKLTGILSELNTEKGYMKLRIDDEYKYYNFKFEEKDVKDILTTNTLFLSKKDGKYGYTDKDGNVVVDYTYDDAIEQNKYGFSAVSKDGLWGAIDSKGNVVVEPKYKLENNLVIDFIGKWHLGQDINMNYYCEK